MNRLILSQHASLTKFYCLIFIHSFAQCTLNDIHVYIISTVLWMFASQPTSSKYSTHSHLHYDSTTWQSLYIYTNTLYKQYRVLYTCKEIQNKSAASVRWSATQRPHSTNGAVCLHYSLSFDFNETLCMSVRLSHSGLISPISVHCLTYSSFIWLNRFSYQYYIHIFMSILRIG